MSQAETIADRILRYVRTNSTAEARGLRIDYTVELKFIFPNLVFSTEIIDTVILALTKQCVIHQFNSSFITISHIYRSWSKLDLIAKHILQHTYNRAEYNGKIFDSINEHDLQWAGQKFNWLQLKDSIEYVAKLIENNLESVVLGKNGNSLMLIYKLR
jgi:hypothetical protein